VIAENLGIITEEVEALREACGFPGMWVLQFRFGAEPMARPGYRPEGTEKNWVVYTGTHDNDTTQSWFQSLDRETQQRVGAQRRGGDDAPICRVLAELALRAPAKWAILPLQDVLGLDGAARMNTPGIPHGNWGWRCADEMLSRDAASWLRATTEATGRAGTEETV
jgi:4-alpha-glucanotransferase